MRFSLPFGRKKNSASHDVVDDWLTDYLSDDEDDEDEDEEEEDDYPFIPFSFSDGLFDDDDDGESIDEDDAKYAWMSRGKDEDYTFGYSEDD